MFKTMSNYQRTGGKRLAAMFFIIGGGEKEGRLGGIQPSRGTAGTCNIHMPYDSCGDHEASYENQVHGYVAGHE